MNMLGLMRNELTLLTLLLVCLGSYSRSCYGSSPDEKKVDADLALQQHLPSPIYNSSANLHSTSPSNPDFNYNSDKQTSNQLEHQRRSDAPKYYALNELLYKSKADSSSAMDPPRPLRPLNRPGKDLDSGHALGGPLQGGRDHFDSRASGVDVEDSSEFDNMIKSIRRNNEGRSIMATDEHFADTDSDELDSRRPSARRASGSKTTKDSEHSLDDTLTQRKTNNFEDDSTATVDSSARLRNRGIPRRRRRASVRQAPPKLKSRRVLRNSRRRKLRHGPPKRRS